jgi:hypothetical protein
MDKQEAGTVRCQDCGTPLLADELGSNPDLPIGLCSRCAMVAELISELLRAQMPEPTLLKSTYAKG